jgi:hypothetical protein
VGPTCGWGVPLLSLSPTFIFDVQFDVQFQTSVVTDRAPVGAFSSSPRGIAVCSYETASLGSPQNISFSPGLGHLHETFRFTSVTRFRTVGGTP